MKPEIAGYLSHIADAIAAIETYAKDHTYEQFLESSWDQSALLRQLEIIGEAATQLPKEFKSNTSHIPWRRISDFRNVLIHHYFAVDPALVWEIVKKDIPSLRVEIEKLRFSTCKVEQPRHLFPIDQSVKLTKTVSRWMLSISTAT